jgi:tetratricopeptide (TPR) repeat protein
MKRRLWTAACAGLFLIAAARADNFMERLRALEPAIGHYPADIKDNAADVKARYEALKGDLDKALVASPDDEKLLAQRGYLQAMGHNADYAGAWEGATQDLTAALGKDPNDVFAILSLANLWVNSRPDLAGKAEMLYRAAQCNLGDKPLEEAQRGLFFAFYYQGKFQDADRQARYLVKTWPEVKGYRTFAELGAKAAHKERAPKAKPAQVAMTTCENKAR